MKILVSACLLGVNCRYDGGGFDAKRMEKLLQRHVLIPVCPEQLGGLATPREPSEIMDGAVLSCTGKDVTSAFERGANEALKLAALYGCKAALLKERSPSCGHGTVYDGSFSAKLTKGNGKTAELLERHGIAIYGESEIEKLLQSEE